MHVKALEPVGWSHSADAFTTRLHGLSRLALVSPMLLLLLHPELLYPLFSSLKTLLNIATREISVSSAA